jgi:hypothetical protein
MELQQPYLIKASDSAEGDYQARHSSFFRRYSCSRLLIHSSQPHTWINSNGNFAERSPSQISEWILPVDAPLEWSGIGLLSLSCEGLFRSPITKAEAPYEYSFRPDALWSEVPEYGCDMSQSRAENVTGWADISGAKTGGGPSIFSVSQQRSPSGSSKVRSNFLWWFEVILAWSNSHDCFAEPGILLCLKNVPHAWIMVIQTRSRIETWLSVDFWIL